MLINAFFSVDLITDNVKKKKYKNAPQKNEKIREKAQKKIC